MTKLKPKPRADKISLCEYCNCMTKTINRKCGKCGGEKMGDSQPKPRAEGWEEEKSLKSIRAIERWKRPEYREQMHLAHAQRKVKHGMTGTRFYRIWQQIISRCRYPGTEPYQYYGGRGIKVDWKNFLDFRKDMWESYKEHVEHFGERNTTIDRIDNDGNYSKDNCRWATNVEQQNHRKNNSTITVAELAKSLDIDIEVFRKRMKRNGLKLAIDSVFSRREQEVREACEKIIHRQKKEMHSVTGALGDIYIPDDVYNRSVERWNDALDQAIEAVKSAEREK